jgi:hypothetical protein
MADQGQSSWLGWDLKWSVDSTDEFWLDSSSIVPDCAISEDDQSPNYEARCRPWYTHSYENQEGINFIEPYLWADRMYLGLTTAIFNND